MLFTTFVLSTWSHLNGIVVLACFVSIYLAVLDSVGTKKSRQGLLFISRFLVLFRFSFFLEQALLTYSQIFYATVS